MPRGTLVSAEEGIKTFISVTTPILLNKRYGCPRERGVESNGASLPLLAVNHTILIEKAVAVFAVLASCS